MDEHTHRGEKYTTPKIQKMYQQKKKKPQKDENFDANIENINKTGDQHRQRD